jgi:class 3 adenylate cyclase/tetratricopeptide (TPR) repeat protein
MKCPRCQQENPSQAKFCLECATPLALRCTNCGTRLPGGAKFCLECATPVGASGSAPRFASPQAYTPKHLAERILTSKAALEGERKHVTILFADVKSSTELAEQVDPEQWHTILDRFFEILTEGVHRFEGTVNQYTGDGIMALFGAPISHEDHALRACYAALHLRERLSRYTDELRLSFGLNLGVRMGINSGEVVVGKIGDDLRMDYTAQGQTVNLAARMEHIAAPGHIYLTDRTAQHVEGYFRLRDVGQLQIKGVRDDVRVWDLEDIGMLRTRLDASRSRGFSKFVGRERELAALEDAFERAASGHGQVVGVVAAAGTGKSRLCAEFVARCRARGILIADAQCPTIGKSVPFLPLLELLRDLFGISDTDSADEARHKIAGVLSLPSRDFDDVVPLVFDLLGVHDPDQAVPIMDPEARKRKLLAFVRHLVQARSAGEPLLIFIDDAHWIDSGSDEFLAQVVEAAAGSRTLVLVNFRPEYRAQWTAKSYYRQLPLEPLGRADIQQLLADLIGRDPTVAGVPDRVQERTGGNPFFTEEVVRSLVEGGILEGSRGNYRLIRPLDTIEIPPTVQAVLAARIDRLPEREREVLQTAALIGKEFPRPILERVADWTPSDLSAALAGLEWTEFIFERSLFPEPEYAFRHPLTQEVALHSQLSDRRRRAHAAIAKAIAEVRANRLDEEAGVLAYHWEEGGHALEAARWHRRAARWTEETDPSESIRRSYKVRALLAGAEETAETIALYIEACRGILSAAWRVGGSDVDAVFAEGKRLAEHSGDQRSVAILLNVYGNARGSAGDLRAYHEHASEALRVAAATGDHVLAAELASDAHPFCWTGRLREAVSLCEQAIALGPDDLSLGRDVFGVSAYLLGSMFRGMALVEMGRFEDAAADLNRASAHPAEQPTPFIWAQAWHVVRAYRSGDVSGALAYGRRTLERADGVGDTVTKVLAQVVLGIAFVANEEWDAAEDAERRALEIARKSRVGFGVTAWALRFLAEARLGRGDNHGAIDLADEALTEARQSGGRLFEIDALLTRACALQRSEGANRTAEAQDTLEEARALIDETGAHCRDGALHEISAEIAGRRGDAATRDCELRAAHRRYVEMGAVAHAERLASEIAS